MGRKGYPVDESHTIGPSLAGVRDAESAWAFIEWFAREWLTPIRDGDGYTAGEVAAGEERLGVRVPGAAGRLLPPDRAPPGSDLRPGQADRPELAGGGGRGTDLPG